MYDYDPIVNGDCSTEFGSHCCGGTRRISLRKDYSLTLSQTSSNTATVNTSWSLDVSAAGMIGFNTSIEYSNSVSDISALAEVNLFREDVIIDLTPSGSEWDCIALVPIVEKHKYITKYYMPTCGSSDALIEPINETWIPVSLKFEAACFFDLDSEGLPCPDLNPPNFNKGIDGELFVANNCKGFIETTNYSYDDSNGIFITWYGPNGYISNDFNIYDISVGIYKYIIINECCDEIEGSIELCDNMNISQWVQQGEKWCRTLSCLDPVSAIGNNIEDCETIECVIPDQVEVIINNQGNCVRRFYYQGELIGEIIADVEESIEYDNSTKMCKKILMCTPNSEPIVIEESSPSFGEWNFNDWDIECTRSIICYDQEMDNVIDAKSPEITEEWDDFFNRCVITYYCDDNEFEVTETPYDEGDWEYSDWDNTCTREVQCTYDSEGTVTVEGEVGYDDWSGDCIAQIYCEEEEMFLDEYSIEPTGFGNWEWTSNAGQCFREVYCPITNEEIIQYTDAEYNSTNEPCENGTLSYIVCNGYQTYITVCTGWLNTPQQLKKLVLNVSNEIKISPNPFYNNINIFCVSHFVGGTNYIVRNTLGQILLKNKLVNSIIDASSLESGIYYIEIYSNTNLLKNQKIIKLRKNY